MAVTAILKICFELFLLNEKGNDSKLAAILFMFIIFPCHCAVYMYEIMILQKPLTQLTPNFTLILLLKCDWVYSNDHAPLTVMPYIIFFFKIKNCLKDDLFISCDDRIGKMLHYICIFAVAVSLSWATRGLWASCLYFLFLFSDNYWCWMWDRYYQYDVCKTCWTKKGKKFPCCPLLFFCWVCRYDLPVIRMCRKIENACNG